MDFLQQDVPRLVREVGPWLILGFLIGSFCSYVLLRWARRRLGAHYRRRGRRVEKKALKLLKSQGYKLVESEPVFVNVLLVDEEIRPFEVTPDLLVEKQGRFFVVEIKSNEKASISNAGVRRQVLEYMLASEYPCLLVVPANKEITLVDWETEEDL